MRKQAKEVQIGYTRMAKAAKICFPGGFLHVETGLRDRDGRRVTAVSITADQFPGEPANLCAWGPTGLGGGSLRIVQHKKPEAL